MIKNTFLILSFITVLSCTASKNVVMQQGIKGKVVWLEGNLMPSIGDSTYQHRAKGKPVQRIVLVYESTTQDQVESSDISTIYSKVKTRLTKKIETNENGEFQIALKTGMYTLFTEEKDGLFANVFDGQGIINPVTVEAGKFTDIVIKVNYKAVY